MIESDFNREMEIFQQESMSHITMAALSGSTEERPVYGSTTVPINNNKESTNHRRPSQLPLVGVTVMGSPTTNGIDEIIDNNDNGYQFQHFRSLPSREPLDIQFKNVSYTVNVGYFKGE